MERQELLAEIDSELSETRGQMGLLSHRHTITPRLFVASLVLVAINIAMFLLSPSYGMVWIASTLLVTLVLSTLAFLPTTRSTAGIGGMFILVRKLSNVRGSNKRVLAALLVSSFLVGGVPMVPGMLVLLGVSIAFALATMLTTAALFLPMLWIVVQCLLIVAFYLWLMRLRPYSADFMDGMVATVLSLRKRETEGRLRTELEFGLLIMSSTVVLVGVFVLPGFSLKLVTMEAGSAVLRYVLPFLVVMFTQMLVVRGWQVEESRRWAEGFLANKQATLLRLRDIAASGGNVELARERLLATRIMRLQSHDLFGLLPIFSFFPDLDLFLTKDLQDELACITASDALRNTGY